MVLFIVTTLHHNVVIGFTDYFTLLLVYKFYACLIFLLCFNLNVEIYPYHITCAAINYYGQLLLIKSTLAWFRYLQSTLTWSVTFSQVHFSLVVLVAVKCYV